MKQIFLRQQMLEIFYFSEAEDSQQNLLVKLLPVNMVNFSHLYWKIRPCCYCA